MRAIDADALLKTIQDLEQASGESAESFVNFAGNRSIELDRLEDYINNAETLNCTICGADRPQGEWIKPKNEVAIRLNQWICSNCHYLIDGKHNFCPNCGADMRGEKDG